MTFGFSSAEVRVSSTESISSLAKAISSARMDEGEGVGVEVVVVVMVVVVELVFFVGEIEVILEVVVLVVLVVVELVVDKLVSEY